MTPTTLRDLVQRTALAEGIHAVPRDERPCCMETTAPR